MIALAEGDCELVLTPECGGGIAAFRWRGIDVMRPALPGAGVLGLASFPLVPFSNRIAHGRFRAGGRDVALPANLPGVDQPHAIHGFGWQAAWAVAEASDRAARLFHRHPGGAWPWPYVAEQHFAISAAGFVQRIALTNGGDRPMPAGLGIHPYFPRAGARLDLAVTGRWESDDTCLPTHWTALDYAPDWLGGAAIDHGFTGRAGAVTMHWPTHVVTMAPASDLAFTIVYVPPGEPYFCVEPVSHMTDAVNRAEDADVTGLRWLAPGERWETQIAFAVSAP
jgi:aldose 1-epimerase